MVAVSKQIEIHYIYAQEDRTLVANLKKHLASLKYKIAVELSERNYLLKANQFPAGAIGSSTTSVILLLLSSDFLYSGYLDSAEFTQMLERHLREETPIVPILLRPCKWQYTRLRPFQVLPHSEKAIIHFSRRDDAFINVANELEKLLEALCQKMYLASPSLPASDKMAASVASLVHTDETHPLVSEQHPAALQLAQAQLAGEIFDRYSEIRRNICDQTDRIEDKTRGFVGRQFVFDAIAEFTNTYVCGYFFISGDPGIGKSSLIAQMVKKGAYVHHFNIRQHIASVEAFLRNICSQLILAYQLDYPFLPPETTRDGGFLGNLLQEVSDKLTTDEKAFILIDALDEVDRPGLAPEAKTLYLPDRLPQGIYIIITTRHVHDRPLYATQQYGSYNFEDHPDANLRDIHEYLEGVVTSPGIQAYIATRRIDRQSFIEILAKKSEGNFMYLHHVLPEIEQGAYKDLELKTLPQGLDAYYHNHWQRMKEKHSKDDWLTYHLPVIMVLAVANEPVSIDLIVQLLEGLEQARVRYVLEEWEQFLHITFPNARKDEQKKYSIYHASFNDFIAMLESIQDTGVDRRRARKEVTDAIMKELGVDPFFS